MVGWNALRLCFFPLQAFLEAQITAIHLFPVSLFLGSCGPQDGNSNPSEN
jgi:hypothetical protein